MIGYGVPGEQRWVVAQARLTREAKRQQTRERLLAAATAEFGRAGMAAADIAAIVAEAGVAHSTFFFHFPTKEHVLLELEAREERLMADRLDDFLATSPDLGAALHKAVDLLAELETTLGRPLFRDFLAAHFSTTRPISEEGLEHPVFLTLVALFDGAIRDGAADAALDSMNSAYFFLIGLYALLLTIGEGPSRNAMLDDYVSRTLRSLQPPR